MPGQQEGCGHGTTPWSVSTSFQESQNMERSNTWRRQGARSVTSIPSAAPTCSLRLLSYFFFTASHAGPVLRAATPPSHCLAMGGVWSSWRDWGPALSPPPLPHLPTWAGGGSWHRPQNMTGCRPSSTQTAYRGPALAAPEPWIARVCSSVCPALGPGSLIGMPIKRAKEWGEAGRGYAGRRPADHPSLQ